MVRPCEDNSGRLETIWTSPSRWVEVSIGLLGPKGKMRALVPMLLARTPPQILEVEYQDAAEDAEAAERPTTAAMAYAAGDGRVPTWDGSGAGATDGFGNMPGGRDAGMEEAVVVRRETYERVRCSLNCQSSRTLAASKPAAVFVQHCHLSCSM